jgi:high-affinity nickel permease
VGDLRRCGIAHNPFLQVAGLAHVEHIAIGIQHAVNAGRIRQVSNLLLDDPDPRLDVGTWFSLVRRALAGSIDVHVGLSHAAMSPARRTPSTRLHEPLVD